MKMVTIRAVNKKAGGSQPPVHKGLKRPVTPAKVGLVSLMLFLLLITAVFISLLCGTVQVTPSDLLGLISGDPKVKDTIELIVLRIRLPRIILAALAGFSLSLGGMVFQALLRNPLADPFILGVSSGGAFGAVLGIMMGFGFKFGIPLMSFGGALLTINLVMIMSRRKMGMESSTILLTGVIINAFFTAMIMFFIAISADDRLHSMLFWLYGDLSQSSYSEALIMAPLVMAAFFILYGFSRHLNLLTAGTETAFQMGVDVEKSKQVCFLVVSLIIGVVVSFSGLIGFVGLIVPHLGRMALGSDHRLLMPVSALGGAILLIAADTLSRTLISPSELPVGVITAFIGAPFFIYLLRTKGSRWGRS